MVVLLLPVLYALSIGPFYWLVNHHYLSDQIGAIYLPLAWIAEQWPAAGDVIRTYLDWWGPAI
jgi:hypothetical protein